MSNNKRIRVNVCWTQSGENHCKTMEKEDAYALKRWLDESKEGFTYWFQALED
jgi:hypothetical protein